MAETLHLVRAVASREAIFSPAIARRLMNFCSTVQPKTRIFSELTDREREILALIAQGRRNDEIAAHLCLSIKTVRNHASNILSKLQVVDRTQAAIRAREAGFAWSGCQRGVIESSRIVGARRRRWTSASRRPPA